VSEHAPQPKAQGNLDVWDKVIGVCVGVGGILPPALTGFGRHWASLYNPPIYENLEPFLIIPVIVALFCSWSIVSYPKLAMPLIFAAALPAAFLSLFLYKLPDKSELWSVNVHVLNWILFYCVVAMGIAMLGGLMIALKRS
jgi:hypothetical protein